MQFEFATAGRIIFGAGKLCEIGPIAKSFGGRVLVVTGKDGQRAGPLLKILKEQKVEAATFSVSGEPEIQTVRDGVALARKENRDWVISIGGGSVLDAGKAIAAMMTNEGDVLDYLEIIGRGMALAKKPAHFVAIPTTAGTGSEVTRNAVLASPEHKLKVSLRSPLMLPEIALVDPELTYNLPRSISASTGLDALTQLIEPYVCLRANPMTDGLCLEGIRRVARSFRRAAHVVTDAEAREDMALASLFGGIALANAGLGAVHGFAGPIGGMFSAPHGQICAALLADVMEMNARALQMRRSDSETLRRYKGIAKLPTPKSHTTAGLGIELVQDALREREYNRDLLDRFNQVAKLLTGKSDATAYEGIKWIRKVVAEFEIPRLGSHGIKPEHADELVKSAMNASSMKANPVALTAGALKEVLLKAI
jgi:alcohol dehydrogenase class IV